MDLSYKGIDREKIKQVQKVKFPQVSLSPEMVQLDLKKIFSLYNSKNMDSVIDAIEAHQNKQLEDTDMFIICEMAKLFLEEKAKLKNVSDLISRDALIEVMDRYYNESYESRKMTPNHAEAYWDITNLVAKQPTVEAKPKVGDWIPCSERLPEEVEGEFYPIMYVTNQFGVLKIGFYRVKDKQWYVYDEDMEEPRMAFDGDIIAWMPLPEPYKEDVRKKVE